MTSTPADSSALLKKRSDSSRSRLTLIAGNWKMHKTIPESLALISELKNACAGIGGREILVCPPLTSLWPVSESIKGSNLKLGAQNLHWEKEGAFTGEISGNMLKAAGCHYVIIGHSERRQYFSETDETVNKKMAAAFKCGLTPIVCVGETLAERETEKTFHVVERQLRKGVSGLAREDFQKLVIAYEPVWAIGTGKTATPQQAQDVHAFIRKIISDMYAADLAQKVRILYGGSVKPDNADALMNQPDIDGGLVGGASLNSQDFARIVKYQAQTDA